MTFTFARATIDPHTPHMSHMLDNMEALHAAIAAATSGSSRPLWHLDGDRIYVLADQLDEDRLSARLCGAPIRTADYQRLLDRIQSGSRFVFDLHANPSKTVGHHRTPLLNPRQRLDWILRKISDGGGTVTEAYITGSRTITIRKPSTSTILHMVDYTGQVSVTDPTRFRSMLLNGVGPGKAYGMGWLMLR